MRMVRAFRQALVVLPVLLLLGVWPAEAAAPRAYVSVNGSDANTCNDPSTPCRTFTGGVSQTTPGGEVVVLDSGTFGGGTISQAVSITAPPGVVALAATSITVNAGASDKVTLRGITFLAPSPGVGTALTYSGGAALFVEHCEIHGWGTGIYAFAPDGQLHVSESTVRENASVGIQLAASSGIISAAITGSHLDSNGYGLQAYLEARATISKSTLSGNSVGLYASGLDSGVSEVNVQDCEIAANTSAGVSVNSSVSLGFGRVRIADSVVTNNGTGLLKSNTGVILSRTDNTVEGNTSNTVGTIGSYIPK